MKRKLLIEKRDNRIRTYFIEDGDIVEIHSASASPSEADRHRLGDIYIGKVSNIVPNIGAAFIEIEKGVNCYYDMKDVKSAIFTHKSGNKQLCIGDELVVQISREAIKTKAPTVTGNLSFTGRYAVLTHGNTRIGVSSKIPKSLREEYKRELAGLQNDDFGLIVRTNAKDAPFEDVLEEINALKDEYYSLVRTAETRVCFSCLKSAPPSYIADLKNVYMDGMEAIIIGDHDLYTRIHMFFQAELPEKLDLLELYDNPSFPLDKLYSTQTALDKALMERAWLKTGGYLIIQPTEALTVIDVNSGKNTSKLDSEDGAMKVNLEAAREAARQIRLRNLSGIILVDFINLNRDENTHRLLHEFRYYLSKDPIQTTLVDMTTLGLVEVTRKKVRRPLHEEERLK
ncbi:MAG TPA: ribonuclease E/G [Candidatus Mediterraneibacter ornithocaccae]|uniref:ribonuclease E/G n=1 Tax=Mediterraneibacter glycyrrhizinilyticus TaxID=342942 RepID=UPI001F8BF6DB|nr:ribonuclease E/G [Mediterraneibacter glycyrrhizinilyticus]MDN0043919.1 ribonuclease E/G [Mediterraneibacter glycyrrhizinilyticus]HJA19070.1 ribonuclease E/G [Candidatus Mediterraneibacter ornithocaccae]